MSIAASGAVSFSDLRTEFVGGSSAISFSQLYRGGSNIRAKAGNNTATNLAASVPASGTINFTNFRSTAKGFRKTYSSGATNQNASSVFGDDYGVSYPKQIVINSGVELGATSTSEEALQIDSGLSGGLTITNNGTLSGYGGAANGGAGGDAFEANVACTLINNGTIRAGGGGGGAGGSGGSGGGGGGGSYTTQSSYTRLSKFFFPSATVYAIANDHHLIYQSGTPGTSFAAMGFYGTSYGYGRTFTNGQAFYASSGSTDPQYAFRCTIRAWNITTHNTNGGGGGSGGGGGAGGRGQGYGVSLAGGSGGSSGSGGSGGGTNAGSGGTGGTGGTGGSGGGYGASGSNGNSGSTGNSGANGNRTNGSGGAGGSGGSSGGAAGKYIRGLSNVTLTQNGTVQGGTA